MVDKALDALFSAWQKAGSPLWDSLGFWRTFALVLVTALAAAWVLRKKILERLSRPELVAHDREKFRAANEILPEQFARDVLTWISNNADVAGDDSDRLRQFRAFFGLEENQFLTTRMRRSASDAVEALSGLNDFIGQHFFVLYPAGAASRRYQLYPDLKHSGSAEKRALYDKRLNELGDHVDKAISAYKAYRRTVKKVLHP